jgi:hypothetical protein
VLPEQHPVSAIGAISRAVGATDIDTVPRLTSGRVRRDTSHRLRPSSGTPQVIIRVAALFALSGGR